VIDYTVNVGHIIQILLIAGGGISALAVMRNILATLKADMTDMKMELRKLSDVLVVLAVTSKRLDNVEEDIRDMKNGRGFINREFP
jgi:ethanolamine ammonia-lyase small subunit